jgi:hypothetical protein
MLNNALVVMERVTDRLVLEIMLASAMTGRQRKPFFSSKTFEGKESLS